MKTAAALSLLLAAVSVSALPAGDTPSFLGTVDGNGPVGGMVNGAADMIQDAVGQAGSIAGDIVNTPLDAISNLIGRATDNKAPGAVAGADVGAMADEADCEDEDEE